MSSPFMLRPDPTGDSLHVHSASHLLEAPLHGLPRPGGSSFVQEALRLVHPVALALVMLMQDVFELPA
jgi:hypothetical protein